MKRFVPFLLALFTVFNCQKKNSDDAKIRKTLTQFYSALASSNTKQAYSLLDGKSQKLLNKMCSLLNELDSQTAKVPTSSYKKDLNSSLKSSGIKGGCTSPEELLEKVVAPKNYEINFDKIKFDKKLIDKDIITIISGKTTLKLKKQGDNYRIILSEKDTNSLTQAITKLENLLFKIKNISSKIKNLKKFK